jgi:hypothetical protein
MLKHDAKRALALGVACSLLSAVSPAAAYNNKTHQQLVNLAWQSMRAGVAPQLATQVWKTPDAVPSDAPSFDHPSDCLLPASDPKNLCGEQLTADSNGNVPAWQAYLDEIRLARQQINALESDVRVPSGPRASCSGFTGKPSTRVSDYPDEITSGHAPADNGECEREKDEPGKAARPNVFSQFTVPDDGTQNQGLVLGWHAQDRDNDHSDIAIDMLPVVPMPFPPYVLPLGQMLQAASVAAEAVLAAVFIPFFCAWSWLSGGSDCVSHAEHAADSVDPIDFIKGILPGIHSDAVSSQSVGLWHFINVREGVRHWYDDKPGMFYDDAGPEGIPGAVDQAIMLMSDLLFETIDASQSKGTSRYEITSKETSFPNPSEDRADWAWQSEPFGHVQFSPLDNFALYGNDLFFQSAVNGGRGLTGVGWVLHALGDATVPMHVVGTTAWGHRPFEVVANEDWQYFSNECRRNSQNPAQPECDEAQWVPQLQTAMRVLERGYRWRAFMRGRADVRELVTKLAQETYALANTQSSLWCDACSVGYVNDTAGNKLDGKVQKLGVEFEAARGRNFVAQQVADGYENPFEYYREDAGRVRDMRELLERSSGAIVGYLLSLPAGNFCSSSGAACHSGIGGGTGVTCCSGMSCDFNANRCCRGSAQGCYADAECCSSVCGDDSQCCVGSGRAKLQAACSADGDCCSGKCSNGQCLGGTGSSCTDDSQCQSSNCQDGKCLGSSNGGACSANGDCTSGVCSSGVCGKPNGGTCATASECASGNCTDGICGKPSGTSCTAASECASGFCSNGICGRPNGGACARPSQCASGLCSSGRCGKPNGGACASAAECASGSCASGLCGIPNGSPCTTNAECALGQCSAGKCGLAVGQQCQDNVACESGACRGGTCCGASGHTCTSGATCCTGVCNISVCSTVN